MGARIHVPRALIAAALTAAGGCIDFVEPDLPQRGAPAVVQAFLRAAGDGTLVVEATLAPGLDEDGFRRSVLRETLLVADSAIAPSEVARNGTRSYAAKWTANDVVPEGVVRFEAPLIADVASPPSLSWPGIRRLDGDTVVLKPGEALGLRIATGGIEDPVPELRQWMLQLSGEDGAFRIGADGFPPDTIVVPARWLPAPDSGRITARLSYTRSGTVRPVPGDYVGLLLLDLRLNWTIRIANVPHASAAGRATGNE
ncbi:MAG: hypothetical protein ACRELX_05315 [Longimicrobiales bacterium]